MHTLMSVTGHYHFFNFLIDYAKLCYNTKETLAGVHKEMKHWIY